MNLKTILILFLFALSSACSDSADQASSTAVQIPAEQIAETDAAEAADGAAEIAIEEAAQVIAAGESEDAAEEEPAASEEIVIAQADPAPAARASRFIDGKHYKTLIPAQPTSSPPDKIEVAEVFMFSCPHCYNFEPHIQQWLENKASYVEYVRIPANFNPMAREHSRAYYAAVQLGIAEQITIPFFREFHSNRNPLNTPDRLATFFYRFGISDAETESLIEAASERQTRAVELHAFTHQIKTKFSEEERIHLIEMLWEVVYADGHLDDYEANLLRRIAGLIHVSDRERGNARRRVLDKLGIDIK